MYVVGLFVLMFFGCGIDDDNGLDVFWEIFLVVSRGDFLYIWFLICLVGVSSKELLGENVSCLKNFVVFFLL